MQAGKKLSSHEPWNKKIIERFERKIQKMMQYIPFQYQHMLLTEEQKNSVMVISVELANVCLHACLGAKVSGEELWHLISHMNNHFMGKKKPSRTSETAKKKSSLWSTAKPSKPANDSEIVCSHTYRVTSTFNKRHQQMFLCVSNTALVQSPLPEAKSSIQPNTSSILCLPVTPADQHFL